jgi:hypothetical protein
MAATVQIERFYGAGATACDITSACTRAGTSDEFSSGSYIPVPSSGSNYSYWVTTGLYCTAAPDNSLNNIQWYTDGANSLGTGITANVAAASSYVQATGTAGSSGLILDTTNHTGLTDAASNAFDYVTGARLDVSGSIGATTGAFGDYVVLQLSVDTNAGAGNSGEETFTWTYDEA